MDIIGLGTVAMDVILQVDSLPQEDGFALIKAKKYLEGGSATNAIVQASRLGAKCSFIAQLGNDEIGEAIKSGLEKENVDTNGMLVKNGGISLHTTIVVGEDGKKFILLNMGNAFMTLIPEQVNMNIVSSGKIFYTDLLPGAAAIPALREAKNAGMKTVFNLQVGIPMMNQFGISTQEIFDTLNYVDVFAPCREAFIHMTGTENHETGIRSFMKSFNGILLLTLGNKGSVGTSGNQIISVPAREVIVKDTTGAGDSYIGSFMYAYFIKKLSLEKAMKFSSAAAAFTCTDLGARSCPTLNELTNTFPDILE